MNVYVESNFVLELAFRQEQHSSCDQILNLCEENIVNLILPAYSLVEPYETLHRRQTNRRRIKQELDSELVQIARSDFFASESRDLIRLSKLLTHSADEDVRNFEHLQSRLLNSANLVPLDTKVLENVSQYQEDYDLSGQDAVVFSSVLVHLELANNQRNFFLNRNFKDFGAVEVLKHLSNLNCELVTQFDEGYQLILNSLD